MGFLRTLSTAIVAMVLLITAGAAGAGEAKQRADIADQYKWDLSSMYANAAAWEEAAARFNAMLPELAEARGHLADSGDALLAAIRKQEEAGLLLSNLYVYAGLKSHEDLRDSENAARFSKAMQMATNMNEQTAYFDPELLAIPDAELQKMINATPGLQPYRHYFDEQLRFKPYTLSEREEKILALAGDPLGKFNNVFSALNDADMSYGEIENEEGETVELTQARYGAFLSSPDRRVREDAWKGLFSEYEKLGNTLAANFEGHVKGRVFQAKARGFDSALHAATYASAIPQEVYLNLIKVAREGAPALQRYLELRRKALAVETLEVWDLYAPLVDSPIKQIDFEEAKNIVGEALAPMGPDYLKLYWQGFEEGWVDVYESAGKRSGAYSWGTYNSKPYLLLNYGGTFSDVSTLAHEYGHSLHRYLATEAQPVVYAGYRTFIAEIASMTNEAILYQKMLAEAADPLEKAFLLQSYLDRFRASFFRQASFADFEMQAYAKAEVGDALTRETLDKLYADVFATYYGDAVRPDPLNATEWSRIPHFMRTDSFYVYQYATSFAAATALAHEILTEGEPARERFLDMLRSGSNDYPIELLKKAGVDMTSSKPVYETLAVFDDLVQQLADALAQLESGRSQG
jgi:oligoendopeptidase F